MRRRSLQICVIENLNEYLARRSGYAALDDAVSWRRESRIFGDIEAKYIHQLNYREIE